MACDHSEHYEIGVDYLAIQSFKRNPGGSTEWDEGSPSLYGTFSFRCHQCGYNHLFRLDSKRPKWLAERIATLRIDALR